jgi:two-component system phosphate regulon sensor histidine kinase PhoR
MGAGAALFFGTGCFICALGWFWHAVQNRRRLRQINQCLEVLSDPLSDQNAFDPFGKDPWLSDLLSAFEKVTDLKGSLTRRVEHAESSLLKTLASVEEGVLILDARHKIKLANPAFVSGFGLSRDPVGRTILEVLGEPEVHRLLVEALVSETVEERRLELAPGKGVRFVTLRAVPMVQAGGRSAVLAVFRDVTRLHLLEQVRREFVANVSHELRTPLAIFQGYVETLLEMPDLATDERVEIYSILARHSNRLNALVEDLLSLARLEARKDNLAWEVIEPAAFVTKVVQDWKVRALNRNICVAIDPADSLPNVKLDRRRIEQVLYNLLENALKHTPSEGAEIRVQIRRSEERSVCVSVEDNGSGIAPQDLPHIFERFYRGDKSRTNHGAADPGTPHSTGLGLSIVKHIVAAHGGDVGAESVHGRGARVWFKLPLTDET